MGIQIQSVCDLAILENIDIYLMQVLSITAVIDSVWVCEKVSQFLGESPYNIQKSLLEQYIDRIFYQMQHLKPHFLTIFFAPQQPMNERIISRDKSLLL